MFGTLVGNGTNNGGTRINRAAPKSEIRSPWASEKPKREALREEKREAILRAAARCFAAKGLDATTMDDVADVLKVTKPTVYRLFRDKTALIEACRERSAALFLDVLKDARRRGGSASAQLRRYFIEDMRLTIESDFGQLQVGQAGANMYPQSSKTLVKNREQLEGGIREIVQEGIASGEFNPTLDPKLAALAMFATFNLVSLWYKPKGQYTLDEIADKYFEMFFDGIRAR